MEASLLPVVLAVGSAGLALWAAARFPEAGPHRVRDGFVHALTSLVALQLATALVETAFDDSLPARSAAVLVGVWVPALGYAFLAGLWLLRLIARRAQI